MDLAVGVYPIAFTATSTSGLLNTGTAQLLIVGDGLMTLAGVDEATGISELITGIEADNVFSIGGITNTETPEELNLNAGISFAISAISEAANPSILTIIATVAGEINLENVASFALAGSLSLSSGTEFALSSINESGTISALVVASDSETSFALSSVNEAGIVSALDIPTLADVIFSIDPITENSYPSSIGSVSYFEPKNNMIVSAENRIMSVLAENRSLAQ